MIPSTIMRSTKSDRRRLVSSIIRKVSWYCDWYFHFFSFLEFACEQIVKWSHKYPSKQMVWLPGFSTTTCEFKYRLYFILFHYIPAFFVDIVMKLRGSNMRLFNVYSKIFFQLKLLEYFMIRTWNFDDINMRSLYNSMSETDHEEFHVRIKAEDYEPHGEKCTKGLCRYFFKENDDDMKIARNKYKLFYVLHHTLRVIIYGALSFFLYSFLTWGGW